MEGSRHPMTEKVFTREEYQSQLPTCQASFSYWTFQPGPCNFSEWNKGKMTDLLHEVQTMAPEQESQQNPKAKLGQTRSKLSKAIPSLPDAVSKATHQVYLMLLPRLLQVYLMLLPRLLQVYLMLLLGPR